MFALSTATLNARDDAGMSNPRSSGILLASALAVALVTAGLVASSAAAQPSQSPAGTVRSAPRSVTDDTVLGVFSPLGEGFDSTVRSLAVLGDGTVYAGGSFATAIGVGNSSKIAAWSNVDDTWHSVGGVTNGDVYALAVQGDDTVVAGGVFSAIGGVAGRNRIALWSNADDTWRALGTGADNAVYALAAAGDDTVYAGGRFGSVGGVPASYVAGWSSHDDAWHALGGGTDDRVLSLAVQGDDTVYAGGLFAFAGLVPGTDHVAGWSIGDGQWHSLAVGTDADVYALAVQADDTAFAGGAFGDAGATTVNQVAAWSNPDATWSPLNQGTDSDVDALAVDEEHGLIYAGGSFRAVGSIYAYGIAVWDTDIGAWLPLQAAGGAGVRPGPYSSHVYAIALDDSVVYLGGSFTSAGGIGASRMAKWTWDPPSAEAVPAMGANSTTIQVRGSGLIGVSGVRVNGISATYTRDDSTTINVAIPGTLYNGTYAIQVDAVGGTATTSYTVTGSPIPPPPAPPSAPRTVTARADVASATVTWSAPADFGSYAISNYQVVATPGGKGCLVSAATTTCEVTGLSQGTAYTFSARAMNGAGWGPWSAPSNAVTPSAPTGPTITITGSRDLSDTRVISVKGTSTGLGMGAILRPWLRFPGQGSASPGASTILVDVDGAFTWQRATGKRVRVYVATADGMTKSNPVVIPAA